MSKTRQISVEHTESGRPLRDLLPAETASAEDTFEVGRQLAGRLRPGDVVALYGELGAGKTVLVKGLCDGLGVDVALVHSPTFTILNEYSSRDMPVFHFDAYRIGKLDEFFELGYEEYFYDDGVSVVEWADKVDALLPEGAIRLRLEHVSGGRRRIELL